MLILFAVKAFLNTHTYRLYVGIHCSHSMVCLDNQITSCGTDAYKTKFLKNDPVYLHNIHTTDTIITFKSSSF